MPRYLGNVEFQNVSFAYKKDYVLKDITFEAKQGQTVALVGHTGSGKSSIINLLFRFYDPQKGTITIDGRPLPIFRSNGSASIWASSQDPYLFTGTIASNVSLGDPGSHGNRWSRRFATSGPTTPLIFRKALMSRYWRGQYAVGRTAPVNLVCPGSSIQSGHTDSRRSHR